MSPCPLDEGTRWVMYVMFWLWVRARRYASINVERPLPVIHVMQVMQRRERSEDYNPHDTLCRMSSLFPLEEAVVRRCTKLLRSRNAWFVKSTGVSLVGCPDLLCCYKGRFIAIEVKRQKDGPYGVTKKQQYELDRISERGGIAIVADSQDDVAYVLDQLDENVMWGA